MGKIEASENSLNFVTASIYGRRMMGLFKTRHRVKCIIVFTVRAAAWGYSDAAGSKWPLAALFIYFKHMLPLE